jgi:hypothetical protein
MNPPIKTGPSMKDLVGSLVVETSTLVQQEIHLASTEMGQKAKTAVLDIAMIGMGGALVQVGVLCLFFAIVALLSPALPMWLSALVLGAAAAGGGGALGMRGLKDLRNIDPTPQQTLRTLKQETPWAKEALR